jgi:hypothetical protein
VDRSRSVRSFLGRRYVLFDSVTGQNDGARPHAQLASILGTALASLLFGLGATFGLRRLFQFPLLLVTVGLLLAVFLVGVLIRKRIVRRVIH